MPKLSEYATQPFWAHIKRQIEKTSNDYFVCGSCGKALLTSMIAGRAADGRMECADCYNWAPKGE